MDSEKQVEPGEVGSNLSEIKKTVRKLATDIIAAKKKRSEINAQIAEKRASVAALGIPKKSFDAALAYYELDEDQRKGLDMGYAIAREALGLPVQDDLFDSMLPAPEAPADAEPKRGRGRPRKVVDNTADADAAPKRGRGRPRKVVDNDVDEGAATPA